MKRDLNLIRQLLLTLENSKRNTQMNEIEIPSFSQEQIAYHAFLLLDDRLIIAVDNSSMGGRNLIFDRLTNDGHNFIDNIRNDKIWKKILNELKSVSGSVSLSIIGSLAEKYLKQHLFGN